jgi:hypothetical protein
LYATDLRLKLYGPNHKSIRAIATILINATVDIFLVPSATNIALRVIEMTATTIDEASVLFTSDPINIEDQIIVETTRTIGERTVRTNAVGKILETRIDVPIAMTRKIARIVAIKFTKNLITWRTKI